MNKNLFEDFWRLYPKGFRREGRGCLQGGKDNAKRAWVGLSKEKKQRAMQAVVLVKKDEFVPHAGKWLRQNYYDSLLENTAHKKSSKVNVLERERKKQGEDYTKWIMEQSHASLEDFMVQMPHLKWLVKKLRPELGF